MTTSTELAITRTLEGSVANLDDLAAVADLAEETKGVDSWFLTASAVGQIVEHYSSGRVLAAQAREWAFFVRHGFMSSAILPVQPLNIDWEPAREDAMAEATTRLEELGDLIDGDLRPGEARHLINLLQK